MSLNDFEGTRARWTSYYLKQRALRYIAYSNLQTDFSENNHNFQTFD